MLIILSGLPGTGKTTLSRHLARLLPAIHLRIDRIETSLRLSIPEITDQRDSGYRIAHGLAEDNLRLGHNVIADSVNPIPLTRRDWRDVAGRAGCPFAEVEILCSDATEHRERVETRKADIAGLTVPDWHKVLTRNYHPWPTGTVRIDTAGGNAETAAAELLAHLRAV